MSLFIFLFLFQSSSQTAIFFFFFTLKTQPCTIQSSKSLLLQPQLKIVYPKPNFPVIHCPSLKMGKGLLRYARWISSFTKLDNNKSNNNNNLKSSIFCLCSILLIHINRGIFTPRVQVYTFRRQECTGATTEKGHVSGVFSSRYSPLCSQFRPVHGAEAKGSRAGGAS